MDFIFKNVVENISTLKNTINPELFSINIYKKSNNNTLINFLNYNFLLLEGELYYYSNEIYELRNKIKVLNRNENKMSWSYIPFFFDLNYIKNEYEVESIKKISISYIEFCNWIENKNITPTTILNFLLSKKYIELEFAE